MDKESGSLGEMEDRLRRIKERRKQLERGEIDPVYEPILPHINEVMRDGQLGHIRHMVHQSLEAIDQDIQQSVRRLRTAVIPDVIPQSCNPSRDRSRDRSRQELLAAVKEKLTQKISQRDSPRVGLRQFHYTPHLEMARMPSVTIATTSPPPPPQQQQRQDFRNISSQTDPPEATGHYPSAISLDSPTTDSSDVFLPAGTADILPDDVIRIVSDILHHEIDSALDSFHPPGQQQPEAANPGRIPEEIPEDSHENQRLVIDTCTQTIQKLTSWKDAATITDCKAAVRNQTSTMHPEYYGIIQTDAATWTECRSWEDRSFREVATSPISDGPEALDSADEGSLTPPRLPLAIDPADASGLDLLAGFDFRLSLSPLPDSLPLPVHPPPQADGADASASFALQDSSSSTTTSSSSMQTSSAPSTAGDVELSEGEVQLRVASPGQIDSRDPTAACRHLIQRMAPQDRSSPEPSSSGQLHLPLDGTANAARIDRDTGSSSPTSPTSSSSFQSLPTEFSSGQIDTNDQ